MINYLAGYLRRREWQRVCPKSDSDTTFTREFVRAVYGIWSTIRHAEREAQAQGEWVSFGSTEAEVCLPCMGYTPHSRSPLH
jgi:hypothetical protein